MKETESHVYFYDNYLSNFYNSPFTAPLTLTGTNFLFQNSEQYFMACKALKFEDYLILMNILNSPKPSTVKKLGKEIKNFDVNVWDSCKYNAMYRACYFKFFQNPTLRLKLLETTGKTLVEAALDDKVWGVGLSENDPLILDSLNYRGLNLLGKVLMNVRADLTNGRFDWYSENTVIY
jgi:ribA/ribD-fused uncharacterized protein